MALLGGRGVWGLRNSQAVPWQRVKKKALGA